MITRTENELLASSGMILNLCARNIIKSAHIEALQSQRVPGTCYGGILSRIKPRVAPKETLVYYTGTLNYPLRKHTLILLGSKTLFYEAFGRF